MKGNGFNNTLFTSLICPMNHHGQCNYLVNMTLLHKQVIQNGNGYSNWVMFSNFTKDLQALLPAYVLLSDFFKIMYSFKYILKNI